MAFALGWRFHRIWSTDWFYNRHVEIQAAPRIAREDNAGGDDADLVRTAARLLGFRRVGPDPQARISSGL
jgi:hypothetical protein